MTNQLYDFVMKMMYEADHDLIWEFWLHKVYDKSFDDFVASLEHTSKPVHMTERAIETTITQSMDMLTSFTPD